MRMSISNIAWPAELDASVFRLMRDDGYSGLEIAPTRVFAEKPYDDLAAARRWAMVLKDDLGLCVPSIQSIWFGRQENLFGTEEERMALVEYTKKAIDFAQAIGCGNLVFGCPRNRSIPEGLSDEKAVTFFRTLGDYAASHHTVIGMEANPPIYHTNYINDTAAAIDLIRRVDSPGFRLNLDVGTMIENGESVGELAGHVWLINHVHISEPGLKPIEERELHHELKRLLDEEEYKGFVSIEMGKTNDIAMIERQLAYVWGTFAS